MARIRIVDEWLRSPVSGPSRHRAILVVADSWAEQRVLMRAFAESSDQTRPTIVLHGAELAIGPAGTDPHGAWGIHVQPPVDGRAQELRGQLELTARRLAGSRGRPPRLADEASAFERKATNNWGPGAPRDVPSAGSRRDYYEPAEVAPPSEYQLPRVAGPDDATRAPWSAAQNPPTPPAGLAAHSMRHTPQPFAARPTPQPQAAQPAAAPPRRRRRGWTSPVPNQPAREVAPIGKSTALGYASGSGAQSPEERFDLHPESARRLASVVGHTMPVGFSLTPQERDVLNALGAEGVLTASRVAEIVGVPNGIGWMEQLMTKLGEQGLDVIAPGDAVAGEPTYVLRK